MTQDDLAELLNAAIATAMDRLSEASEFAPFALAMETEDGELLLLEPEAEDPDEEIGDSEQVRALLVANLREGAVEGRFRATALVRDVTLEDEEGEAVVSAIHVALEHAGDEPVTCVVPYAIGEEAVELADLEAEPGERVVFREMVEN